MALTRADAHLLPCGRGIEDLWTRLDSTGDEHERHCPHCRTARTSLHALAEATRAVLADESLTAPPGLHNRIMFAVRAEVRRGQRLPLPAGDLGPIDVSEQAVAAALRFAADTVSGVRARRCRVHNAHDVAGREALEVRLGIAIAYSPDTSIDVVQAVRDRVVAAAAGQVGLDLLRVDVQVEDVYFDGD